MAPAGQALWVDGATRAEVETESVAQGLLLVPLPCPGPAVRGRLALYIEAAIEDALERRGAAPPGVGASSDLDASLSDQLYRARQAGAPGLALSLYSLAGITNLANALDAEDSAVLRWWLAAVADRPVRLLIDERDRFLSVYGPPMPLARFVEPDSAVTLAPPVLDVAPSADPELAASSSAMELSVAPPTVAQVEPVVVQVEREPEPEPEPAPEPEAQPEPVERVASDPEPSPDVPAAVIDQVEAAPAIHVPAAEPDWRSWMRELDTARGPRPLAMVERMFVSAYVPLADALRAGYGNAEAEAVLASWAASFDKSYSEAFDALRVRGKRPTMVLDLPDVALRIARLHGARAVQLLLVDGMRFDLGVRVSERLSAALEQRAALTERLLLWSALPTTTAVQLELLGKGPAGLREPIDTPESEIPVARGKAATTPRRVRAGHKELFKLDIVESAMSVPGGPLDERLDALADETAEVLAAHLTRQAPRTLVIVFGDHGFIVEPRGAGTSAGLQGGASPEEVLVPAFAWLVGAVH